MATKIRLSRLGRKNVPYYHIIIADSRSPRDGKFIEEVGTHNPLINEVEKRTTLKKDRIEYWLSVGAVPTERVALLLIKNEVKGAEKYKPVFVPKQKKVVEKKEEAKKTEVKEEIKEEVKEEIKEEVKTE